MLNKEPLLDLLRTNTVSRYLARRSQNPFISKLRELLHSLGFGNELQWNRLGSSDYFGNETTAGVRAFCARNRIPFDGMNVTAAMLSKMIQRQEALEGLSLLQRSQKAQSLQAAFNLSDPLNYGSQQLMILLENLDIYEPHIGTGLRLYAQQRGIPYAVNQVNDGIARSLIADLSPTYGDSLDLQTTPDTLANPSPDLLPMANNLRIVEQDLYVTVSDGSRQIDFRKHAQGGLFTVGHLSIERFVDSNQVKLGQQFNLTPSALAVVKAVAENEGKLDGINTYDAGFLSFGIFQWNLGSREAKGELPALLKKVKAQYPATFSTYFKAFGLDISDDTDTTLGFMTYNGTAVNLSDYKNQFREPTWAFRFWRAGQEADVQAIQVEHAIGRLKNFYWKPEYAIMGYGLNQIVTSSFGVALLLDNHVNRPAWVSKCLELGIQQSGVPMAPETWTDQEEQRVLAAYLSVRDMYQERQTRPMTESRLRADKIYRKVQEGKLSDRRGSFQISELAMRSNEAPTAYDFPASLSRGGSANAVPPPPFYAPQDYPILENEEDRE
jgi:hypothetical protein